MQTFSVNPIGEFKVDGSGFYITVAEPYRAGLTALAGFSHLAVLWWFSELDAPELRTILTAPQPYKKGPETIGVFATRGPARPNPLALTMVEILRLEPEQGLIEISYTDANANSPILDIKPYTPSADRIEHPATPEWCAHWPKSWEASGDFAWEDEFNF